MASVEAIIARMIEACGAKDQQEMLAKTGMSSGLASKWKKRGRVSEKSIARVSEVTGVRFEWLKTGIGKMRASPYSSKNCVGHITINEAEALSLEELDLLNAFRVIGRDKRTMFLRVITEEAKESRGKEQQGKRGGGSSLAVKKSA